MIGIYYELGILKKPLLFGKGRLAQDRRSPGLKSNSLCLIVLRFQNLLEFKTKKGESGTKEIERGNIVMKVQPDQKSIHCQSIFNTLETCWLSSIDFCLFLFQGQTTTLSYSLSYPCI